MRRSVIFLIPFLILAFLVTTGIQQTGAQAKPVSILATWGGDEQAGFQAVLDASKIPYSYEGNRDSTIILKSRVAANNAPDIAFVPRPGEVAAYARQGSLIALNEGKSTDILSTKLLQTNYGKAWIDLGTVDGKFYGLIAKANSKSTFWYKPASLKAIGASVPQTWDQFIALEDRYIAAGKTPLSVGAKDGWTMTDWFENIYVRIAGPDLYQKLHVTHEVKWTDDTVVAAVQKIIQAFTPEDKKLAGGAEGTLSTGFIDAFNLVLKPDAAAEMYYEGGFMGSFAAQNFPSLKPGKDYDFFMFPSVDPKWGTPVTGGGDLMVVFANNPQVAKLVQWLASKEANTIWASAKKGSVVSPNKLVSLSVYAPLTAKEAKQLTTSSIFVFDGSDQAPAAVGGDAEFTAFQKIIKDPDHYMDALKDLEDVAARSY
ncbi:MAG: carbohydrate ABC transporter substrate-binding protein [Spirochaetia bacterium]